jgi:hypothetical protein
MENNLTKEAMLCETMHKMFKDNHFTYLDMEDLIVMWQALADHWQIFISDNQWEEFTEEINTKASTKFSVFQPIFDKYFNN